MPRHPTCRERGQTSPTDPRWWLASTIVSLGLFCRMPGRAATATSGPRSVPSCARLDRDDPTENHVRGPSSGYLPAPRNGGLGWSSESSSSPAQRGGLGRLPPVSSWPRGTSSSELTCSLKRSRRADQGLPGVYEHHLCDVSDETDVQRLFDGVRDEYGRVDVLANIAGVVVVKTFVETTWADFRRTAEVNVGGTFLACRYAIPLMPQGSAIVNMGLHFRPHRADRARHLLDHEGCGYRHVPRTCLGVGRARNPGQLSVPWFSRHGHASQRHPR